MSHDLAERLAARTKPNGDCLLWTGYLNANGYGVISVGPKRVLVHRLAYELAVGPIPEGLTLDHVRTRGCQYRNCVNPAHLEPVDRAENTRRSPGFSTVNAAKTHCVNGHPYDATNTYRRPNGARDCRACIADRVRRYRANRQELHPTWAPA